MTTKKPQAWRPPTRRAFVAMVTAAAAAIAVYDKQHQQHETGEPARNTWAGTTRWIGHC